ALSHYPVITDIFPLSLHDALPIWSLASLQSRLDRALDRRDPSLGVRDLRVVDEQREDASFDLDGEPVDESNDVDEATTRGAPLRSEEHTSELQSRENLVCRLLLEK